MVTWIFAECFPCRATLPKPLSPNQSVSRINYSIHRPWYQPSSLYRSCFLGACRNIARRNKFLRKV